MKDAVDLLDDELVTLASRIGAAEYRFLDCVRRLEDVIVLLDCTYVQWLGWRLGIEKKTAYERVRVARALAALPKISEAFAQGLLSYSKVRVVTRVASAETDALYVSRARECNVRQLESLVAGHRVVLPDEAKKHMELRSFSIREDDSGMYVVHGHHVIPWSQGGKTTLDNLVLVCSKHHRWLHEGGYTIVRDNGQVRFRDDRGNPVAPAPPLPPVAAQDSDLATLLLEAQGRIRGWNGDKLDLDWAIYGLLKTCGVDDAIP